LNCNQTHLDLGSYGFLGYPPVFPLLHHFCLQYRVLADSTSQRPSTGGTQTDFLEKKKNYTKGHKIQITILCHSAMYSETPQNQASYISESPVYCMWHVVPNILIPIQVSITPLKQYPILSCPERVQFREVSL